MSTHNQPPEEPASHQQEITFLTILGSVFSSFFGVQSNANRKRDFESGKFWHFFVAGLVVVAVFLTAIWMAVRYLIATSS